MNTKRRGRTKGSHFQKIYWDRCSVCQYMKRNPGFRLACMQSSYFKPEGTKSLAQVVHEWGDPFGVQLLYQHVRNHQPNDLLRARKEYQEVENKKLGITTAVEGQVVAEATHEKNLDEFIKQGHEKVLRGEMTISATTYLTALKIRADIDKNTKDRRLEAAKAFFAANNQTKDDDQTTSNDA